MFRMPWNEKKHEVINAEAPKQSRLKREIKGFVISAIVSFVVVFAILAGRDFIKIQDQYWHDAGIPYPIKEEYILDNYLRFIRFSILSENDGGFLASWLQQIHYKLYLKIKAKIPDDDPFWIMCWVNASHVAMQDYNEKIKQELLANLNLLATKNKSKVKDFNDYYRFLIVDEIFRRMAYHVYYYKVIGLKYMLSIQALKIVLPMVDDLFKITFINNKAYMKSYKYSYQFSSSLIVDYALAIKANNKTACDKALSDGILFKLGNFIFHGERNKNVFAEDGLKNLKSLYQEALTIYNQAYKEAGCKN